MLLIPSIDLRRGRCVRLREGDFATETAYPVEPAALLRRYHSLGARWLHIVDLDGARDGVGINASVIASLARYRGVNLQVGGGVRSAAVIEGLLTAGVARVVIGSAAVQRPAEVSSWLKTFGVQRICVAFDVKIGPEGGPPGLPASALEGEPQVHTHGWTVNSALSLWNAIGAFPEGSLRHLLCTDIARDGTLRGPNFNLYRDCFRRFPMLSWQASGGIRNAADLAGLARSGVAAAVSGTALIEERIPIKELQSFLPAASSPASTYATARS
jgi:phosphoribosylformimino-5-aminoimidazole carboxamide ribotide isomerase